MEFQELNLTKDYLNDFNTFTFNGQQVKVLKYLTTSDKNDLIAITLQKSKEEGLYNEIFMDVFFHLNIIYLYSNIEFSAEDRIDELELYDKLEYSGFIDEFVANMEKEEYDMLVKELNTAKVNHLTYDNTAAAVVRHLITDLPANIEAAKDLVENFEPEQFQEVIDFATAANGGRDINTQQAPVRPLPQPQDHLQKQPPKRKVLSVESAVKKD